MKTKLFLAGLALMLATTMLTAQNLNGKASENGKVQGEQFVDSNNDGVCDNFVMGQKGNGSGTCDGTGQGNVQGQGQGRGKANHTGNGKGNGTGNCENFVDANNNGICDIEEAR